MELGSQKGLVQKQRMSLNNGFKKWEYNRVEEKEDGRGREKRGTEELSSPNFVMCMFKYITTNPTVIYNYNVPITKTANRKIIMTLKSYKRI